MDFPIRPITPEQWGPFIEVTETAFGESQNDDARDDYRRQFEFERTLAAFDGDRIVGSAAAFSMELTLPGGSSLRSGSPATIPVGGLAAVGVLPTHRRRGILRALVDRHLREVAGRGELASILTASEAAIYGRFGYGPAISDAVYEIEPRHSAFREPPRAPGSIRLLAVEEAEKALPAIYDRVRRQQPGELSRSDAVWEVYFRDGEYARRGATRHFDAVYEEDGRIEGWAAYRVEHHWTDALPDNLVRILGLHVTSPAAYAALFRYCLDLDLATRVRFYGRANDEPLRWLLADPRRLQVKRVHDHIWVRLLDLPAALAARGYAAEGALVIEVADATWPANHGRFALEAGPDGASCRRSGAEPDLALDVADLGAAYLGGVRFSTLARAGRAGERTPGALRRADAMFASEPEPYCTVDF